MLRCAPYRDTLQLMSVRRRKWTTKSGEPREAWVVAYTDATGKRHIETFERKKDADNRQAAVKTAIAAGIHVPTNKSATIAQAARDWLVYIEGEGIEPTTLRNYSHYIRGHLVPRIGNVKLAALTAPRVHLFRDELVRDLSRITAQKVLITLKAILKDDDAAAISRATPLKACQSKRTSERRRSSKSGWTFHHGRKLPGSLPLRRDVRDRSL